MTGRVEGKVAFITGAARGQGRSHAVRLAQEGADVIAVDLCGPVPGSPSGPATEADLAETVRLVEAEDRRVVARAVDVRDSAALRDAVDAGVSELGRLDIVLANAGIASLPAQAIDLDEDSWDLMLDTNLKGVWLTCKVTAPHLIAGGRGGSIVLTGSAAGLKAFPNLAHYAAAKHGVVGLMKTLAQELAPHRIRVNSVHPTAVGTDMLLNQPTYDLFRPDLENPTREDFAQAAAGMSLLGVPWVEPVDVSNAVLFLASEEARYVTGVSLPVDAGLLTR